MVNMTNKQIQIYQNKLSQLEKGLEKTQELKQLQLLDLAAKDPDFQRYKTEEFQLQQRIGEHTKFIKTMEDMINGGKKDKEKEPGKQIDKRRTPKSTKKED